MGKSLLAEQRSQRREKNLVYKKFFNVNFSISVWNVLFKWELLFTNRELLIKNYFFILSHIIQDINFLQRNHIREPIRREPI